MAPIWFVLGCLCCLRLSCVFCLCFLFVFNFHFDLISWLIRAVLFKSSAQCVCPARRSSTSANLAPLCFCEFCSQCLLFLVLNICFFLFYVVCCFVVVFDLFCRFVLFWLLSFVHRSLGACKLRIGWSEMFFSRRRPSASVQRVCLIISPSPLGRISRI